MKTMIDIQKITPVFSQGDWSLKNSTKINSLCDGLSAITDPNKRLDFFNNVRQAFEKTYGLDILQRNAVRVLMIAGDLHGCSFVRIENPATFINREPDIIAFPTVKITLELLEWADVVVWQRQHKENLVPFRDTMKKLKKPQIFDLDDNLHKIPEWNPAYKIYNPKTQAYHDMLTWIKECDIMTVTKKELGEFYKKLTGTEYVVIPNCINFEKISTCSYEKNNKAVRICWTGSPTHSEDLKVMAKGLKELKEKYGEKIEIVMFGWDGANRDAVKNKKGELELRITSNYLEDIQIEYHKAVDIDHYYNKIASLNIDIGLIPLCDHEFNHTGKSAIKFYEFSACKVPCVVSKSPVYDEVISGENGLIAKKEHDWVRQVSRLIDDKELRIQLAENAYNWVKENRSYAKNAYMWANLYRNFFLKSKQK